jgi:hypothetical protein
MKRVLRRAGLRQLRCGRFRTEKVCLEIKLLDAIKGENITISGPISQTSVALLGFAHFLLVKTQF